MADDDTVTTCHAAVPFDNGTVLCLRVATDGEGFVTTVSRIEAFPDGSVTDLFEDSVLVGDMVALSQEDILLAETTGRIIEIRGTTEQDLARFDHILGGIFRSTSSIIYAFGTDGAVFAGPDWVALPRMRADVLAVHETNQRQIYACGGDGLLAQLSSADWEEFDLGTNVSLNAICGLPDGSLIVVGMNGFAGLLSGGEWSLLDLPTLDYYDACLFQGEVYIGAGSDGLHVWRQGELVLVKANVISYTLRASEKYLAIAGDNEVVRYDGKSFPFMSFDDELEDG